jgi:hypothetical protein
MHSKSSPSSPGAAEQRVTQDGVRESTSETTRLYNQSNLPGARKNYFVALYDELQALESERHNSSISSRGTTTADSSGQSTSVSTEGLPK